MAGDRAVVVGYIPTPEGLAALRAAKDSIKRSGGRLVVVNTGNHGNYSSPLFATAQDLDALDAELADDEIEHEVTQPTEGRPAAEELLAAAEASNADLIVIGLRRRSPIGKLFMGSTAQQVLLDANCAVLAVKANAGA